MAEASSILGVTAATLRQQIKHGSLKATKRGRDWFVTAREVERYRRESRRGPSLKIRTMPTRFMDMDGTSTTGVIYQAIDATGDVVYANAEGHRVSEWIETRRKGTK